MLSKFCEVCVNRDECCVLDPFECGEYMSFEEYIDRQREEYRDAFFGYIEYSDED